MRVDIRHLKEKDDILEESLDTLVDSPLNDKIIFQGGGALHFIYSSPRYSSDVDFVDPSITEDIQEYRNGLLNIGSKYNLNTAVIMKNQKGIRAKWGHVENSPNAKVEIEERAADEYEKSKGRFNLLVKSPEDIYTDKIFANIARYVDRRAKAFELRSQGKPGFPFKPSDFFDLNYLKDELGVDPVPKERILNRARAYDKEDIVNYANLHDMMTMINDPDNHDFFRHQIEKTMMPDVFKVKKFDKAFFNSVSEHFEKYRDTFYGKTISLFDPKDNPLD